MFRLTECVCQRKQMRTYENKPTERSNTTFNVCSWCVMAAMLK